MGKNWAIAIGIDEYDCNLNLRYAKADAKNMGKWFEAAKFDKVVLFTEDSLRENQPNYAKLRRFLYRQVTPHKNLDTLCFFFAGHGKRGQDGDYLMLADSDPGQLESTALRVNEIAERLKESRARNIVMFLDACRDCGSRGGEIEMKEYKQKGIAIFYSCDRGEISYEIDKLGGGSFTYTLLKALRDTSKSCITVRDLEDYLKWNVPQLNVHYGKPPQNPLARIEPASLYLQPLFGTPDRDALRNLKHEAHRIRSDPEGSLALWWQVLSYDYKDSKTRTAILRLAAQLGERFWASEGEDFSFDGDETEELRTLKSTAYRADNPDDVMELWWQILSRDRCDRNARSAIYNLVKPNTALTSLPMTPDIELLSDKGIDYARLQALLKQRDWKEAAWETRRVMLTALGVDGDREVTRKRIKNFPCNDLCTIDRLWKESSEGRFGFSVQKEIWLECGGQLERRSSDTIADKFCNCVKWKTRGEFKSKYKEPPRGHLPETWWLNTSDWHFLFSRAEKCGL